MAMITGKPDGAGRRFAIVVSRFNEFVTARLLEGARTCLLEYGVLPNDIDIVHVPGAWEIPLAAQRAAATGAYHAIVALGCVIRGETAHFDYIAGSAARGLARVSLDSGLPIAFGVLTTEDDAQALDRAGGRDGNKGWDAALSALEMVDLARQLDQQDAPTA